MYRTGNLRALLIHLQYISGRKDENIFLWDSQILRNVLLGGKMTVFPVNRNRIFRTDKRIDQFDFLLTGMSLHMHILEDNLGSFHRKLIDHL